MLFTSGQWLKSIILTALLLADFTGQTLDRVALLTAEGYATNVGVDSTYKLFELIALAAAGLSAIIGTAWAVWRVANRIGRVLPFVDKLHLHFGDDPASELHELVKAVRSSIGELEVRQRISERHLEIGIFVCDIGGKCTWANDILCNAFGLDSQDMLGFGWLAAIAKTDQTRVHRDWIYAIENELPYSVEYKVEPESGTHFHCIAEAWPVSVNDKCICYVGYIREVQNSFPTTA